MTEAERFSLAQKFPDVFTEPFSGEPHDSHYGAVPANPYYNEEVKDRQAYIKEEFGRLFEYPPEELGIPESFKNLLMDDYIINVERRRMINYENFAKWRQENKMLAHPDLEEFTQRAEKGYATPGEILDLTLNTGLSGLEVSRVSHPYWRRIEYVSPMRYDVGRSIVDRGGELTLINKPYRRVKIVPHTELNESTGQQDIIGFIVRYKRDVGQIPCPDGSVLRVVERQVAGYRTDEASGFPQDIIENMQQIAARKKNFRWDNTSDERFSDALASTRCTGFINKAVQDDSAAPFVIPESTTIYCYKEPAPEEKLQTALGRVAYRAPDSDDGIAFYNSQENK